MDDAAAARTLWPLVETVHAVTYFAPEHRDAMAGLGLKGWWMGYFASRAAPMGPVEPAVVSAVFHGFHPRMVGRALPDAWTLAGSPATVLAARLEAIDAVLRRVLGDAVAGREVVGAAEALAGIAAGAPAGGRPLGAANQAMPRPVDPHLVLWQACTTLRELRGDGHVAALTAHGIDGLTAHVLKAAAVEHPAAGAPPAHGVGAARLREVRGFDETEWDAAVDRAREQGLLDAAGALTLAANALVDQVEALTDRLAGTGLRDVPPSALDALATDLHVVAEAVLSADVVPFPNPIGVPRP